MFAPTKSAHSFPCSKNATQRWNETFMPWMWAHKVGADGDTFPDLNPGKLAPIAGNCPFFFNPHYKFVFIKNTKVGGTSVWVHFGMFCEADELTLTSNVRPFSCSDVLLVFVWRIPPRTTWFPSSCWSCQCPCGCGTVVKRYIIPSVVHGYDSRAWFKWWRWYLLLENALWECLEIILYRSASYSSIALLFDHRNFILSLRKVQMKWHKIAMTRCVMMSRTHFWSQNSKRSCVHPCTHLRFSKKLLIS